MYSTPANNKSNSPGTSAVLSPTSIGPVIFDGINLQAFLDGFCMDMTKEMGRDGISVQTGKPVAILKVPAPEYLAGEGENILRTNRALEAEYIDNVKRRNGLIAQQAENHVKIYGHLMSRLPEKSLALLKGCEKFSEYEANQDFFGARHDLIATHVVSEGLKPRDISRWEALYKLLHIGQLENETVTQVQTRVASALSTLIQLGIPEEMAKFLTSMMPYFFIDKVLDSGKFAHLKVDMQNAITPTSHQYPESLAGAANKANTHVQVVDTGSSGRLQHSVYSAQSSATSKTGGGGSGGNRPKNTSGGNSSSESKPTRPCKHCNGDHFDNKCPTKTNGKDKDMPEQQSQHSQTREVQTKTSFILGTTTQPPHHGLTPTVTGAARATNLPIRRIVNGQTVFDDAQQ